MKKIAIFIVALIIAGITYFAVKGSIVYEGSAELTDKDFECAKGLVHVILDNPLEKNFISKVKITKSKKGQLVATAYFPLGLPYGNILVSESCDGATIVRH